MDKKLYYQDKYGDPITHVPFMPVSTGLFSRPRYHMRRDFYYVNPKYGKLYCPAGMYDGFSVGKFVRFVTLGTLQPYMPVFQCTIPHDVVCHEQRFTKKIRRELFMDAYDDAVRQFYDGVAPDRRRDTLIRGVIVGSKLGAC